MSDAKFDAALLALGPQPEGQEYAKLFARSGWNPTQLKAKLGASKTLARDLSRFGRFLNKNAAALPDDLSEWKFRKAWATTSGTSEDARFGAVLKILTAPPSVFADGEWHPIGSVAKALGCALENVEKGLLGYRFDKKTVGPSVHYRVFVKGEISAQELTKKLKPIIEKLVNEGGKRQELASPAAVGLLAHELQKLLNEWNAAPAAEQGE